jgi:outer membrane protein
MTTPIVQGILEAVKRIAAQEGFEMVLEKSAVPYFRGDLELTDRAIQMYNSGAGKGAPAPAAPAAPPAKAPAAPAAPPAKAPAPKK